MAVPVEIQKGWNARQKRNEGGEIGPSLCSLVEMLIKNNDVAGAGTHPYTYADGQAPQGQQPQSACVGREFHSWGAWILWSPAVPQIMRCRVGHLVRRPSNMGRHIWEKAFLLAEMKPTLLCYSHVSFAGGLVAVIYTDALQTLIMVIGSILLTVTGKAKGLSMPLNAEDALEEARCDPVGWDGIGSCPCLQFCCRIGHSMA